MNATTVDLKYKIKEILGALEQRECVTLLHRGKVKGTIVPITPRQEKKVAEHEFFGMLRDEQPSVEELMANLRAERYHGI